MVQPLISVMMPAKNTQQFIGASIESIILQTYQNWELLIVDDKSTDDTRKIANNYAKKDKRIKVIEGNGVGVANARNKIIDHAHGKYIMLQDSDDLSKKERMQSLLSFANKHPLCLVGSNMTICNTEMKPLKVTNKPGCDQKIRAGFKRFFNRATVIPQTVLASLELYKQYRYNENYKVFEDWDLILRISSCPDVVFGNIEEPLYLYRRNSGSLMADSERKVKYNVLLRLNELNRKKNRAEIQTLEELDILRNKYFNYQLWYLFFTTMKKMQLSSQKIKSRLKTAAT